MEKNELTIAFEKLGIKRMTDRIESGEDPNIRFSKFDTCYVSGVEYEDGRVSEHKRYERLSDTFERAFKVLEDYCYELDDEHYRREKDFLSCDYCFRSLYSLPSITIDINKFHTHLYHIRVAYQHYDSTWYDTKDLEKDLNKILEKLLDESTDKILKRELKLRKILC